MARATPVCTDSDAEGDQHILVETEAHIGQVSTEDLCICSCREGHKDLPLFSGCSTCFASGMHKRSIAVVAFASSMHSRLAWQTGSRLGQWPGADLALPSPVTRSVLRARCFHGEFNFVPFIAQHCVCLVILDQWDAKGSDQFQGIY